MHLVSMQQPAGVESHFTEFVSRARVVRDDWTHGWLNPSRAMHPFFAERLRSSLAYTVHAKYWHGVKLPSRPRALRALHCKRGLARARTDVLLIWNRSAKVRFAVEAARPERCVHWEHGAAWDAGHEKERREYFRDVSSAIANSQAAARYLQLLWGYAGAIHVCRNALRPSLLPESPVRKPFPAERIKLGVAARLYPVKGVALALHAVASLLGRGIDVTLAVAGAGPELERLRAVCGALGLHGRVRFLGAVRDMEGFYRSIDCLVHPPLTEAFGRVAIEAAAFGCPVVAAAIDGLPEAVSDGISGYCVRPTIPLADYEKLGGARTGLPPLVYDPARDRLVEPPLVDPAALADAVARVFSSAECFEALSASASEHVLRAPGFDAHVRDVMAVIDRRIGAAPEVGAHAPAGKR
jgi:glycosyltransferase involved in cell wall biosynthesis